MQTCITTGQFPERVLLMPVMTFFVLSGQLAFFRVYMHMHYMLGARFVQR